MITQFGGVISGEQQEFFIILCYFLDMYADPYTFPLGIFVVVEDEWGWRKGLFLNLRLEKSFGCTYHFSCRKATFSVLAGPYRNVIGEFCFLIFDAELQSDVELNCMLCYVDSFFFFFLSCLFRVSFFIAVLNLFFSSLCLFLSLFFF